jgi:tRNA threonylcarbamoyladenosine biosynthesis protein TsaE
VYRFELINEEETEALASLIAELSEAKDVITLKGPLGVGKSTFARAFIRALTGLDTEVPSPTYTLVQTYEGDTGRLYHFDLYRLNESEEVWELGLEEALGQGISLIEWPERLPSMALKNHLSILLEMHPATTSRVLYLTPDTTWQQRFDALDDL